MLLRHLVRCALFFARERAGSSMLASMAMIAITTSNSIKVKASPARLCRCRRPATERPVAGDDGGIRKNYLKSGERTKVLRAGQQRSRYRPTQEQKLRI